MKSKNVLKKTALVVMLASGTHVDTHTPVVNWPLSEPQQSERHDAFLMPPPLQRSENEDDREIEFESKRSQANSGVFLSGTGPMYEPQLFDARLLWPSPRLRSSNQTEEADNFRLVVSLSKREG